MYHYIPNVYMYTPIIRCIGASVIDEWITNPVSAAARAYNNNSIK